MVFIMDPLLKSLGFDAHNKKYIFFETNFQQLLEQKKTGISISPLLNKANEIELQRS